LTLTVAFTTGQHYRAACDVQSVEHWTLKNQLYSFRATEQWAFVGPVWDCTSNTPSVVVVVVVAVVVVVVRAGRTWRDVSDIERESL